MPGAWRTFPCGRSADAVRKPIRSPAPMILVHDPTNNGKKRPHARLDLGSQAHCISRKGICQTTTIQRELLRRKRIRRWVPIDIGNILPGASSPTRSIDVTGKSHPQQNHHHRCPPRTHSRSHVHRLLGAHIKIPLYLVCRVC